MKTPKQLFRESCVSGQPLYDAMIAEGYDKQAALKARETYIWRTICAGCGERVNDAEFAEWVTYWNAFKMPAHERCLPLKARDAYECQKIDAACNDCGYFQRERSVKTLSYTLWFGKCSKHGIDVKTCPNTPELNPCFVHRRDMQSSINAPSEPPLKK